MAFCASCGSDYGQAASCPNCGTPQGYSATPASGPSSNTLAMWAHLGPLVVGLVGSFAIVPALLTWLPPLIIKQIRPNDEFLKRHANESLNFQLQWIIISLPLAVVMVLFTVFTLGFGALLVVPLVAVLGILLMIMMILAAVAASNGKEHKYPFMLFRLVKN
jgi:uncharacterized Tic20 family protein